MRIVDVRERTVPISRYIDPALPSGGLTTSIVAVTTDQIRDGVPVVGYGFSSIGRFAQGGLIRERFIPRLLNAGSDLDPFRAWNAMMAGEKPGGHGERCVAVGTLDMAIWDAAAKIEDVPLNRLLAHRLGRVPEPRVRAYAGGGYYYPQNDASRLAQEIRVLLQLGFTHVKIKIGGVPLAEDLARIETVLALLPADRLAVDAMNAYDADASLKAAQALKPFGLWWFEDVCDPLDFLTQAALAQVYPHPIAAGEALFSLAEAKLMHLYGGLRPMQDILLFDPVHCYGLTGYLRIVDYLTHQGWPRSAFWPHGGHIFSQHVVSALGLGGVEVNPLSFAPFGGLADGAAIVDGCIEVPDAPGAGFESKLDLRELFERTFRN